jgi:hypothetical protein
MLGFRHTDEPKAAPKTKAQIVLRRLDDRFAAWSDTTKASFADLAMRLVPIISREADRTSNIPAEEIAEAVKAAALEMLPTFAWNRKQTWKEIVAAAHTDLPTIREWCSATYKRLNPEPKKEEPNGQPM